MLKKYLKNQKGLTLVELLAVIVILGIIAAIAVPTIGNVIEKTRFDAVRADAMQVLDAAKLKAASEGVSDAPFNSTELNTYIKDVSNLTTYEVQVVSDASYTISFTTKEIGGVIYKTKKNLTISELDSNDIFPKDKKTATNAIEVVTK
ncbi:prepilin-type N-terminal cleavage/methylation domain-containing protein [Fredinandcohnia sp. QZ13]|uniref:type IV pilin protein n=1 Tax=Fredinandcohnia sp. QZ13 TaxID=3073144 RepID=UPI002852F6D0|nr:prepilin-type N-terminal cleavage/methylation domain-containing protein [Fredinandcohnia sp. QZ13]MDR4889115.1 prepilin-type N-terminal cleavage/methylation domain-containing protein [Fredinandcohnia sp. QZ13]